MNDYILFGKSMLIAATGFYKNCTLVEVVQICYRYVQIHVICWIHKTGVGLFLYFIDLALWLQTYLILCDDVAQEVDTLKSSVGNGSQVQLTDATYKYLASDFQL